MLIEDSVDAVAIGWADPEQAGKVLGRHTFHPVQDPRRFRKTIPVSIVIGVGESEVAARRAAHAAGFDRQTRAAASAYEVSRGCAEVVAGLLGTGPVDLNALVSLIRHGTEESA